MEGQFADLFGEGVWLALVNLILNLVIHSYQVTALHESYRVLHLIRLMQIKDDILGLEHELFDVEVREEGGHLLGDLSVCPGLLHVLNDAGD